MQTTPVDTTPRPETPASTGCCPRFEPDAWRQRQLQWFDKLFVRAHVRSIFHVPVGLRAMFTAQLAAISRVNARSEDPFVLADEGAQFRADYYFPVTKAVPGAETVSLRGTFACDVFEGPYRNVPAWMRAARERIGSRCGEQYLWYTTCPKCAQAYGENYVVVFSRLG